jgi:predicted nuclease of predicted toxin-antitoxin system
VSDLFIKLYLDEDVDVLIADLVRARGFVATTTQEAGQIHASDSAQLAFAASQGRTIFTHNRWTLRRSLKRILQKVNRTLGSTSQYAGLLTRSRDDCSSCSIM